jgi:IS30 family transposase
MTRRDCSSRSNRKTIARAASTISREITRNGGASCYRAAQADQAAWQRAHRPKQCKLAQNHTLARLVTHKLQSQWSRSRSQAG